MGERSGAGHLTTVGAATPTARPQPPPEPAVDGNAARAIARRELLILVVACLWCFDIAVQLKVSDALVGWVRRHQGDGLGEAFVVMAAGLLGLALIAWRRHVHGLGEARKLDQTERVLAVTTERYRSLFEFHPSAVFSVDFDGHFTATNAACEEITGYTGDELRQMRFYDLLARGYVADTELAFVRALGRQPQRLEAAIVHADGQLVELAVTGLPIVVDDAVVGVYGIAEDITEARRAQRELVRHRVEAEQANEAKSLFLANVSHEIRSPLSSLLGTTELLRDSELDEAQIGFVDAMDRSCERLLGLTNQVLEFSRFEVGTSGAGAVPFDVRLLVGEVAALMRPAAAEKGLFFKFTVGPGIPELVHGDPARIAQVLTNLLDNAIKFTESGWVRLVVTSAHNFGDRVSIRFEVHDSGIGVSKDQERRLYLAFSQVAPTTNRDYDGTGLGLAISQQLVTTMGGAISLSSAPGLGSAFSFSLRFALPTDPAPAAVPSIRAAT